VQKAFVDLARSNASLQLLQEKNDQLQRKLKSVGEEAERTRQELDAKQAEVVRLNSVIKQKEEEIGTAEKKRRAAEADHRAKDKLVKERDEALKLVEERPVVERVKERYVNDYSARRVLLAGVMMGLGVGAVVMILFLSG
jgi:chromosome segregation ATPase